MIPPATAVSKCLETLANVLDLHVVELWSHDHEGFGLVQVYVNKAEMKDYTSLVSLYHQGKLENLTSRNLCKRAMKSKQGFYWLAKSSKRMHQEIPLHTATSFHLPRDNVSTDVFVVGFSLKYIKVSLQRTPVYVFTNDFY
jgi:hypothetical protein